MSQAVLDKLKAQFPSEVLSTHSQLGNDTAVLRRDRLAEIGLFLRDDPALAMNLFRDVTAVDNLARGKTPRFEVVYHLYSLTKKHSIRLVVPVEEADPTVPTLSAVWAAANWGERETWDMYGVRFSGHPDLRRILLYEEFEGHPLRKDYDKRKSQPRTELRDAERDSVAEYRAWEGTRPKEQP